MIVKGGRVVSGDAVFRADVGLDDARITRVADGLAKRQLGETVVDASDCYVVPGAIDPHVHVTVGGRSLNEEMLDDLATASAAALYGGVTSLGVYVQGTGGVDLLHALEEEIEFGKQESLADFFVHALILPQDDVARTVAAAHDMGIRTYKAFMAYFGLGRMLEDDALVCLMENVAQRHGTVLVHPESGRAMDYLETRERERRVPRDAGVLSRIAPAELEAEGILRAALFAHVARCRLGFVHVTSELGLSALEWVAKLMAPIGWFVETQPHYGMLTSEAVADHGALAKVGPVLKSAADAAAVARALRGGRVNHLSSDHSPRMAAVKLARPDILDAPYGGISGVELLVPLAVRLAGGLCDENVARAVELFSTGAARAFGLYPRKGSVTVGADADLIGIAKSDAHPVRASTLHGRSDYSLYEGIAVDTEIRFVIKSGRLVIDAGRRVDTPRGGYLVPRQLG